MKSWQRRQGYPSFEARDGDGIDIKDQGQLFLGHALGTSPAGDGFAYGKGKLVAHGKPNLIGELPSRND